MKYGILVGFQCFRSLAQIGEHMLILYHLVDNSIIFSGKINCSVKICREKKLKLTNRRHLYLSHFCWMFWGAGKFVVKTARVYSVNNPILTHAPD